MSFNIWRGTLGSLAMFTAIRNASSRVSSFAARRLPLLEMYPQLPVGSPDYFTSSGGVAR
jgi:hypothetical protein